MTSSVVVEPWVACDAPAAAARLRGRSGLAWLDSSLVDGHLGRWSIVASDPRWTLTGYEDGVLLECASGPRRLEPGSLHAFARLVEREGEATLPPDAPDGLPFAGGAIGYLGFDTATDVITIPGVGSVIDTVFQGQMLAGTALQKDIESTHWVEASEKDARAAGLHDMHVSEMRRQGLRLIVYLHD